MGGGGSRVMKPVRGLRHRDLLSPILFILCMERLLMLICKAVQDNMIGKNCYECHQPVLFLLGPDGW